MQQIERYGVIALVFLLVTIVAVSFWGDSKSPGFWSRLTGRGVKKEATSSQTADAALAPPATAERAIQSDLPMSPAGSPAPSSGSLVTPLQTAPPPTAAPMATAPAPSVPARDSLAAGAATAAPGPVAPAPTMPFRSSSSDPVRSARAVQSSTPAAGSSEYVVQKGDSMMQIATRMLGSKSRWTEIRDMNPGIDPRGLKVGTKLSLPVSASASRSGPTARTPVRKSAVAPASKEHPVSKGGSGGTYVVRKGDTMKSIAERELGDGARWKEIAASNPSLDPHHLSVGTSLHVPGGKSEPLVAAAMPSDLLSRPHVR